MFKFKVVTCSSNLYSYTQMTTPLIFWIQPLFSILHNMSVHIPNLILRPEVYWILESILDSKRQSSWQPSYFCTPSIHPIGSLIHSTILHGHTYRPVIQSFFTWFSCQTIGPFHTVSPQWMNPLTLCYWTLLKFKVPWVDCGQLPGGTAFQWRYLVTGRVAIIHTHRHTLLFVCWIWFHPFCYTLPTFIGYQPYQRGVVQ